MKRALSKEEFVAKFMKSKAIKNKLIESELENYFYQQRYKMKRKTERY